MRHSSGESDSELLIAIAAGNRRALEEPIKPTGGTLAILRECPAHGDLRARSG
jgi:hypothetical protein